MTNRNRSSLILKALFIVSALWNFSGAVPGIIDPLRSAEVYFGMSSVDYFCTGFLNRTVWICVFSFGIAYGIVALNPLRHTGIILVGVIGKILFAANFLHIYVEGHGTWLVLGVAIGDFAFACAFVLTLFHARKKVGILT